MKKLKKCKGINKAHGFEGCGEEVLAQSRKAGLCEKCYYKWWLLHTPEGKKKIHSTINVVQKPRKELEKAAEERKNHSSLESLKKSVMNKCHKYIRLRDKYKNCASCNTSWNEDFQAGHYYPADKYSNLKYDERNINGQCRQCNLRGEGNFDEYTLRLPDRIGHEAFADLQLEAAIYKKNGDFKWDREELIEIRNYYHQKIKELEG